MASHHGKDGEYVETRHAGRRAEDANPLKRWTLQGVLAVLAILGFVAQMGMNWQIILSQGEAQRKMQGFIETTLPEKYVPREIFNIQQENLKTAITDLTEAIRDLKNDEKRAPSQSTINSRMFDK